MRFVAVMRMRTIAAIVPMPNSEPQTKSSGQNCHQHHAAQRNPNSPRLLHSWLQRINSRSTFPPSGNRRIPACRTIVGEELRTHPLSRDERRTKIQLHSLASRTEVRPECKNGPSTTESSPRFLCLDLYHWKCGERIGCGNRERETGDRRVSMGISIRKQKQRRRRVSRIIGLILLLSICAMTLPLPMMVPIGPSPEKETSESFPCQNRPCGCRSAEQCWKKCCCFSNAQKVAWAKANNVEIPDFVRKAAELESASASKTRAEICSLPVAETPSSGIPQVPACCGGKSKVSVAENQQSGSNGPSSEVHNPLDDGSQNAKSCCCTSAARSKSKLPSRTKIVSGLNAAECQGTAFFLTMLSMSLASNAVTIESSVALQDGAVMNRSERLPVMSLRPPLPPPKIAA